MISTKAHVPVTQIDGLIVAGPTASGKSRYALELAQERNGVIINGDALQLTQGLPILTALPGARDCERVPHRLYGFFAPDAPLCSAAAWVQLAEKEIEQAHQKGQTPLIVGGTGFYLNALQKGLSPIPNVPRELVLQLEKAETPDLWERLSAVDPHLTSRLTPQDRQRIVRGLSVYLHTGVPLTEWQKKPPHPPRFRFRVQLLSPPVETLDEQIAKRLDKMLQGGVLEEVQAFLTQYPHALQEALPPTRALGFKAIAAYLEGDLSLESCRERVFIETRQYAKRQRTWFRHQLPNHLVEQLKPSKDNFC